MNFLNPTSRIIGPNTVLGFLLASVIALTTGSTGLQAQITFNTTPQPLATSNLPVPPAPKEGAFSISSKPTSEATALRWLTNNQTPAAPPFEFPKRDANFFPSLQSRVSNTAASVVRFENEQGDHILGTVISRDGMIVSKHSVAKKMQHCILPNGKRRSFRITAFDTQKDLCLISTNRRDLTPIHFRRDINDHQNNHARLTNAYSVSLKPPASGTLAMSVGHQSQIAGFGMVTLGRHDFKIQQPQCPNCVDTGLTVSPYPSLTRINGVVYPFRKGLQVLRVYPRSVGERMGLLVGDLINTVNGATISERQIFTAETQKIRTGDVITMKVFRRGAPIDLAFKVPLVKKTKYDRWGGGPYSERRFGLGPVVVHDSVIDPQDCGGPLVDVEGNVIGINIARAMRVASFAIGIEDVYLFIKTRSPETKLTFDP